MPDLPHLYDSFGSCLECPAGSLCAPVCVPQQIHIAMTPSAPPKSVQQEASEPDLALHPPMGEGVEHPDIFSPIPVWYTFALFVVSHVVIRNISSLFPSLFTTGNCSL